MRRDRQALAIRGRLIGPVHPLERDIMVLHEDPEQRRVMLLLANEQFNDPRQRGDTVSMREALRRSQERTSLRLFSELKRRNRARNEPPLIGP
jgi:hypothetical protein